MRDKLTKDLIDQIKPQRRERKHRKDGKHGRVHHCSYCMAGRDKKRAANQTPSGPLRHNDPEVPNPNHVATAPDEWDLAEADASFEQWQELAEMVGLIQTRLNWLPDT